MPNDNMMYSQEDRDQSWNVGTSPETGGRSYPGYFDTPPSGNRLDPSPQEPANEVGNPQTTEEAYLGSFQAVLQDNLGYFVVIEFLIGTNGLTEKEGVLYAVGNNFVTLYEAETDRYIVCDLFSIKFVTFFRQRPNGNRDNRLGYESNMSYGGMVPRR